MKRIILSAILAGTMAVTASAYAQMGQASSSQASSSQAYGANNGANAPTPYAGPSSYGTTAAADQQAHNMAQSVAAGTPSTGSNAACGNASTGASASAGQATTCITQENDAIWNPGGVQDDHGQ